ETVHRGIPDHGLHGPPHHDVLEVHRRGRVGDVELADERVGVAQVDLLLEVDGGLVPAAHDVRHHPACKGKVAHELAVGSAPQHAGQRNRGGAGYPRTHD